MADLEQDSTEAVSKKSIVFKILFNNKILFVIYFTTILYMMSELGGDMFGYIQPLFNFLGIDDKVNGRDFIFLNFIISFIYYSREVRLLSHNTNPKLINRDMIESIIVGFILMLAIFLTYEDIIELGGTIIYLETITIYILFVFLDIIMGTSIGNKILFYKSDISVNN